MKRSISSTNYIVYHHSGVISLLYERVVLQKLYEEKQSEMLTLQYYEKVGI